MVKIFLIISIMLLVMFGGPVSNVVAIGEREFLQAPRTYYVRSDGSDSNDCLTDSPTGACRTWQHVLYMLQTKVDFGGHDVTIQHGNEANPVTFVGNFGITGLTGGGNLHLRGSATPGKTILTTNGLEGIGLRSAVTPVHVWDMTLTGNGVHIMISYLSTLNIRHGVIFGACDFAHVLVHDAQAILVDVTSNTTISGSCPYHVLVNGGMSFIEYSNVTFINNPNFYAYLAIINGGKIQTVGNTFTGAVTGHRYSVSNNGIIQTFNSGPNYLPGSLPGVEVDGGIYR